VCCCWRCLFGCGLHAGVCDLILCFFVSGNQPLDATAEVVSTTQYDQEDPPYHLHVTAAGESGMPQHALHRLHTDTAVLLTFGPLQALRGNLLKALPGLRITLSLSLSLSLLPSLLTPVQLALVWG
jgi:hypothetical protein